MHDDRGVLGTVIRYAFINPTIQCKTLFCEMIYVIITERCRTDSMREFKGCPTLVLYMRNTHPFSASETCCVVYSCCYVQKTHVYI